MLKLPSKVCETVGQMFLSPIKKRESFLVVHPSISNSSTFLSCIPGVPSVPDLNMSIHSVGRTKLLAVCGPGFAVCVKTRDQRIAVFKFGTDRVRVLEKTSGSGSGTDRVRVLALHFYQSGIIGY